MIIDFDRTIRRSENYLNKYKYNFPANKTYVDYIVKAIQAYKKEHHDLSSTELKNGFHVELSKYEEGYEESFDCAVLLSYETMLKQLLDDNNLFRRIYEEIKDENLVDDYDEEFLSGSLLDTSSSLVRKNAVRHLTGLLRKQVSEADVEFVKDVIKLDVEQAKNKYGLTSKMVKSIYELKDLYVGDEFTGLVKNTARASENIKEVLKEAYINNMVTIGNFFEKFDLYDHYIAVNKIESRKFDIDEMQFTLDSNDEENEDLIKYIRNTTVNRGKKSKKEIDDFINELRAETKKGKDYSFGLKDIFTENFLKQRSLEEIQVLNVFWENRFAKEIRAMNDALFYVDTLDLWDDIANGKEIDASDSSVMDAVMLKIKYIDQLTHLLLATKEGQRETVTYNSENQIAYDVTDVLKSLDKQIGEKYKKYFDRLLPGSSNNIVDELKVSMNLFKNKENAYFRKDQTMITLMHSFINNKKIKNWGYMEEFGDSKDINEKKYILLGIDFEGMNMPLRVHIKKDDFIDRLQDITHEAVVPIYEGADDFWRNGEYMRTHIITPLDSVHKKIIRFLSTNKNPEDKNYKLIKHLDFLRKSDAFPEHLKVKDDKKGKLTREKRFIDLRSGRMYRFEKGVFTCITGGDQEENGSRGSER